MSTNDPKFQNFMTAIQRPVTLDSPPDVAPTASEESLETSEFEEFSDLIEADCAQILVPVSQAIVEAHQQLIDYEIDSAESKAIKEYWIGRREPKISEGVSSIPLGDALEAFDFIWADKNQKLENDIGEHGELCSPRAEQYYDAIAELNATVWAGDNADHLLKKI